MFNTIGRLNETSTKRSRKIKITGLRVLGMLTLLVVTLEIECNRITKIMTGVSIRHVVLPDTLWS